MYRKFLILFCMVCVCQMSMAELKLLFIGDSLTEGYGLDKSEAYPATVQKLFLQERGMSVSIINGGVSGSTTSSGLSRLKWFQRAKPDVVVIALGANDGLRGVPVEKTYSNLAAMLEALKLWETKVVLCGMQMPPNYGEDYRKEFSNIFPKLAKEYGVGFVPFLLEGVGGVPKYNLPDGIHPNAEGYQKIGETVYRVVEEAL